MRQHGALKNWIDRGELSAVRLGSRRVRVKQSDLDRFIEESSAVLPDADQPPADTRSGAELREQFASALEASSFAVADGDDAKLVPALNALAEAASQLAQALEASPAPIGNPLGVAGENDSPVSQRDVGVPSSAD